MDNDLSGDSTDFNPEQTELNRSSQEDAIIMRTESLIVNPVNCSLLTLINGMYASRHSGGDFKNVGILTQLHWIGRKLYVLRFMCVDAEPDLIFITETCNNDEDL